MTQRDPGSLLALTFDSSLKANEAFLAFKRLVSEQTLVLHDAVFISKTGDGSTRVTETVDVAPADGAVRSGLWGALIGTVFGGPIGTLVGGAVSAGIGALTAKLIDIGIPDDTVKELEQAVAPGTTTLALLVSHVNAAGLEAELKRFSGAKLVRSDLSQETVTRLTAALDGNADTEPPAS